MPRKLNTLLERLLADETYKTTTGNTEPSISYGFFGNVTFKPWKGFGQIVDSALLAIERLNDEAIAVADRRLAAARDEITLKRKKHERLNAVPVRNGAEGGSVSSAVAFMNELGMEPSNRKKRKTAGLELAVRGPVTNSQSILTQYSDVMAAIGSLMDNMCPDLVLIMDQRMVAGESLNPNVEDDCLEVSDVEIGKAKIAEGVSSQSVEIFVPTVEGTSPEITANNHGATRSTILSSDLTVKQPISSLPSTAINQAAEDGVQTVTGKLSESVTTNRVREPSSVLPRENKSQGSGMDAELESSQEMRGMGHTKGETQLLRRSARLANKRYSFVDPPTGSAIIKLRQTADQALFLASEPATAKVPVCCFELKGPKLNYTGLPSDPDGNQSDTDMPPTASTIQAMQAKETSNTITSDTSGASGGDMSAGACQSSGDFPDNNESMYIPKAAPGDVASIYNELFSKIEHFSKDSGTKNQRTILLPVIQVLCQALLTQSGCAILTNHQTAIAFRVEEGSTGENAVKVFVTGVIPCDRDPGSVAAMLALAKYALDKDIASSPNELLEPKKRLLRKLSYEHYKMHPQIDHDRLDPNWTPGHDGSSSAFHDNHGGANRSRSKGRKSTITSSVWDEQDISKSDLGSHPSCFASTAASLSELNQDLCSFSEATSDVQLSEVTTDTLDNTQFQNRSPADETMSKLFSMTTGVIAVGGSGLVLRGVWQGKRVAVKIWNGQHPDGFFSIRKEIRIYKNLEGNYSSLLGDVVPRILFSWDNPESLSVYRREVVLVTELVGNQIIEDQSGNLWVEGTRGFEAVSKAERVLICTAALRSLSKLHSSGFLHGDVCLRNLRISRAVEERLENFRWSTWWVDLGRTIFVRPSSNKSVFEAEKIECISIFNLERSRALRSLITSESRDARQEAKKRSRRIENCFAEKEFGRCE